MNRATRRALEARKRRARRQGDQTTLRRLEALLEALGAGTADAGLEAVARLEAAGVTLSAKVTWEGPEPTE